MRVLIRRAACTAALFLSLPLSAAYHLELEARPAAVFPFFAKFGTVDLHVYEGGVHADTFWLDGFSRNRAQDITVMNPLGRMYTNVPVADIASIISKLGSLTDAERGAAPALAPKLAGSVLGVPATRNRLVYGPTAYIDVWTTNVVPENVQLRTIVNQFVNAISPGTAAVSKSITGTPVYVELNFRRFKKVALLKMKKLTRSADDEAEALKVGSFYVKAPLPDALWR